MLILVFIWAIGANWIAIQRRFYHLPKQKAKVTPLISHFQLIIAFGLYVILSWILTPLVAVFVKRILLAFNPEMTSIPIPVITALQFTIMAIIFILLLTFFYTQDRILCKKLWKNRLHFPSKSIPYDFGLGIFTWILSFPVVSIINDFVDKTLKSLYHYNHIEQNAVKFVKVALGSPLSLIFALLSVLVCAPLIEEFLFRGVLQTYLKKRLGTVSAILLSALSFALFHYSSSQGIENISLIISLFILGGYLGFLYEKQGSLWAPIGLHISFNLISALRILLFPELS